MVRNLGENKVLWRLTAVLSLIVALVGVFSPGIYSKVISTELMPAVFGQDWITVVASVIILIIGCSNQGRGFESVLSCRHL